MKINVRNCFVLIAVLFSITTFSRIGLAAGAPVAVDEVSMAKEIEISCSAVWEGGKDCPPQTNKITITGQDSSYHDDCTKCKNQAFDGLKDSLASNVACVNLKAAGKIKRIGCSKK